jgi:ABC-type transport system involved in multi-copper enzyme maturation permease subunit
MLSLPLLARELRVAARAPGTYRSRAVVAAVGVVILGMSLSSNLGSNGAYLFSQLHKTTMLLLGVAGVLLTADTISKERREGTLELLFLTPLTEVKLVLAKFTSHLLRLLSVWAVILPVSIVPFVAGGLAPADVITVAFMEATIICLSLVAGLLASVYVRRQLAAMILGLFIAAALLWMDWNFVTIGLRTATRPQPWVFGINLLFAFAATALVVLFTAQQIARGREKAGDNRRALWFQAVFLTPVFWKGALQKAMKKRMDANPLIWLEYRTAWSRVGRYVMIGFLVVVESYALLIAGPREIATFHFVAALVLLTIMALTAASSFQREKENGAFELLLVAPFTERSLMEGRIRAVWSYYLPVGIVFGLLLLLISNFDTGFYYHPDNFNLFSGRVVSVLFSVFTVPLAGFYFALRQKHFVTTFLSTVTVGLLAPLFLAPLLFTGVSLIAGMIPFDGGYLLRPFLWNFPFKGVTILLHLALIAFFVRRSDRCLKERQFA